MGIDAQMLVKTRTHLSEKEVRGEDFFEGHRRAEAEWTVVSR